MFSHFILQAWVPVALSWLVAICLSTAAYRLILHPLAKYPGPFLGRCTDWYSVYHAWKGGRHIDFYRLHEYYGDIIRFGPNRISINSSTALQQIYGFKANTQKSSFYTVFSAFFKVPGSLTTINKKDHSFKRRIVSQALTAAAVRTMENIIIDGVRTFCNSLLHETSLPAKGAPQGWSSKQNMTDSFGRLTFDIIGDLCFGRSWNVMNSKRNRRLLEIIPDGVAGLLVVGHMPAITKLKIDQIFFHRLVNDTRQLETMSEWQTDRRIASRDHSPHPDIFQKILEARDPETGHGMGLAELNAEALTLIVAGSHSTATTLSATLFYLLSYPSALHKLQLEVRSMFRKAEDVHMGNKLSSCRYLRACLDEAMRMTPPIGGILPREVLRGGIVIDGEFFPPGTDVGVPCYACHHNERYFPEAFSFKPERWLADDIEGSSEESILLAQSAFCPFSLGPRGCPGKELAYAEMMIILANLVILFDMSFDGVTRSQKESKEPPESGNKSQEFHTTDKFIAGHDGPMVAFQIKERSSDQGQEPR